MCFVFLFVALVLVIISLFFGNCFLFRGFYCWQVKEEIVKYAKKGLTPSQIGVILRDSFGIPQVRAVTGVKILRILKVTFFFCFPLTFVVPYRLVVFLLSSGCHFYFLCLFPGFIYCIFCCLSDFVDYEKAGGLAPALPEDLYHLIKKAVNIRKHLERNRKDTDSKFRLILVESRVHRLARYYKVNITRNLIQFASYSCLVPSIVLLFVLTADFSFVFVVGDNRQRKRFLLTGSMNRLPLLH